MWRVVQGSSESGATASHKGPAAFSLDLQLAPGGVTCGGEEVRAVAAGTVSVVVDDDDTGDCYISVEHYPSIFGHYLHNAKGSSKVSVGDHVVAGQHLANVGEVKCHLHFDTLSELASPGVQAPVTIPFAFAHFDVCTPAPGATECTEWVHVKHGLPLNDQWVRWD